MTTPITIAFGDGQSRADMDRLLIAIKDSGADIVVETIEIGQRVYDMGGTSGVLPYAWESLRRTKILLKAPTNPPPGADFQDASATLRDGMGLDISHRTIEGSASCTKNGEFAVFEPLPDSGYHGLKAAAILLLNHLGQQDAAKRLANLD